jgi:hypothetical protein
VLHANGDRHRADRHEVAADIDAHIGEPPPAERRLDVDAQPLAEDRAGGSGDRRIVNDRHLRLGEVQGASGRVFVEGAADGVALRIEHARDRLPGESRAPDSDAQLEAARATDVVAGDDAAPLVQIPQARRLARQALGVARHRTPCAVEARGHEAGCGAPVPLADSGRVCDLRREVVRIGAGADERLQLAVAEQVAEGGAKAGAHLPAKRIAGAAAAIRTMGTPECREEGAILDQAHGS